MHLMSPEMGGKDVMTLSRSHVIQYKCSVSALEALGCLQMPCTAAGARVAYKLWTMCKPLRWQKFHDVLHA